MSDDKFQYIYSAPTEQERREIEDIRKSYTEAEKGKGTQNGNDNKMERLRELNRKVLMPAKAFLVSGIVLGVLLLGVGMSVVMTLENFPIGVPVGVLGIVLLCIVYPIYRTILKKRKNKYAKEILSLSEELLGERK